MATQLRLIQGGLGKGRRVGNRDNTGGGRNKPLHERMSRLDKLLQKFYIKLALSKAPFFVTFWATGKLGRLHGKYGFPSKDDTVAIRTW